MFRVLSDIYIQYSNYLLKQVVSSMLDLILNNIKVFIIHFLHSGRFFQRSLSEQRITNHPVLSLRDLSTKFRCFTHLFESSDFTVLTVSSTSGRFQCDFIRENNIDDIVIERDADAAVYILT